MTRSRKCNTLNADGIITTPLIWILWSLISESINTYFNLDVHSIFSILRFKTADGNKIAAKVTQFETGRYQNGQFLKVTGAESSEYRKWPSPKVIDFKKRMIGNSSKMSSTRKFFLLKRSQIFLYLRMSQSLRKIT